MAEDQLQRLVAPQLMHLWQDSLLTMIGPQSVRAGESAVSNTAGTKPREQT
jgi:hypothetical protein